VRQVKLGINVAMHTPWHHYLVSSCAASMQSSSPSKGEAKTGAQKPPCSGEVVSAAGGVESGVGEGMLGAEASELDADGESPTPLNPLSSA
jgi:uncharacterized membrane protein